MIDPDRSFGRGRRYLTRFHNIAKVADRLWYPFEWAGIATERRCVTSP